MDSHSLFRSQSSTILPLKSVPSINGTPPVKKQKTLKKRCKRCLKSISVGPLENGLYFRRKQQYFSVCSGLFTLLGGLALVGIAISVLINILQRKLQNPEITFQDFNLLSFNLPLAYFLDQTQLNFKVRANDYWDEIPQQLTCRQFAFELKYMEPVSVAVNGVEIACRENDWGELEYGVVRGTELETMIIENTQYFSLSIHFLGTPPPSPSHSKLYLSYTGKDVFFSGLDVQTLPYKSKDLPFGYFYKTQIAPFWIKDVRNVWQIGFPHVEYKDIMAFHFEGGTPYYSDEYPELKGLAVKALFKYNNDNNPFMVAALNYPTVIGGLTTIGGYVKIFGLLKIALYFYNKRSFEHRIFRQYKPQIAELCLIQQNEQQTTKGNPIQSFLRKRGQTELDMKALRDLLSYEMLIKLVIDYLNVKKIERQTAKRLERTKSRVMRQRLESNDDEENNRAVSTSNFQHNTD
ncbi:hypothetical protein FGO68_gene10188 [Halteria grandinella]|uniref:Transmembrane protein n=1 Tax=Halteria grandinella TaxID=5974 RepID=A0A8J8NPA0_HALGN|nr:hypothetical protein FGO68_gene10188 [Halteria grandinella]